MADVNVNRVTHLIIDDDEITTGIESGSMFLQRTLLDGNLSFGRFCSSRFELRLHGREIDETEKEDVSVYQVENPDEEDEEIINIFTGNIDSAKFIPQGLNSVNDVVYDLVMYDKSYFIRQKDCAAWWETFWTNNQSATLKQLRESLLSYVGLSDENTVIENEDITIPKKPVEITRISFADMFEYITAISGTVPFIDGAGVVRYWNPSLADTCPFDNNVEKANSEFNKFSSALIIGYAEQLGGDGNPVASYEQEAEIGKISLKYNPILSDVSAETLEDALEVIVTDYYTVDHTLSGTVKAIVCDPTVELGSLITVGDNKLLALKMNMSGSRLIEQEFISDLLSSDSSEEVTEGEFSPEFIYLSQQIQSTKEELEEQIDDIQVSEEYAQAVDTFNSAMAASTGLLSVTVRQESDGTLKKYFYAPSTNETLTPQQRNSIVNSGYIFTMTSNGFAWTNKWEGSADATSESHTDPTTGDEVATIWNYGIDRNGNAILRSLTVNKIQADQIGAGAITADKIQAGAITVGNLGDDVLTRIDQGSDGINVHATAETLSTNNYPLTTSEGVTELAEGDIVAITFPNGIDFTLNTNGNTYLYKPRTVSIGSNTYTLLNANGTTDWCNVKDSTDYSGNVTVKYIARLLDSTLKLCELVEAENVQFASLKQSPTVNTPFFIDFENPVEIHAGDVFKCDVTNLPYGVCCWATTRYPSSYNPPYLNQSVDSEAYTSIYSKTAYDESYPVSYTSEELKYRASDSSSGSTRYYFSTDDTEIYIIFEYYRESASFVNLVPVELRFDPYSTAPMAIDQEARDAADRALLAAMAASTAVDELDSDVNSRISDAISGITVEGTITTFYGTCGTLEGTATKVVNVYTSDGSKLDDSFTLKKGAIINVSFTYANTATTPTLNVNNTGAKAIYVNNAQLHYGSNYTTNAYNWKANTVVQFMYDGSYWRMSQTSADLILANFCADNNMTVIDGSKIYAGTVTSKKIQAASIYATDALLGNLMACNATITGLLKIIQSTVSTSDSKYTSALNYWKDAFAANFGYTSYNDIPTGTSQAEQIYYSSIRTYINAQAPLLAQMYLLPSESPFKLYLNKNNNYYCKAAVSAIGLLFDDPSKDTSIESDNRYENLSVYGYNAQIGGTLTVGGKTVTPLHVEEGSFNITITNAESGKAYELESIAFTSVFSSAPSVVCSTSNFYFFAVPSNVNEYSAIIRVVANDNVSGTRNITVNWKAIGT